MGYPFQSSTSISVDFSELLILRTRINLLKELILLPLTSVNGNRIKQSDVKKLNLLLVAEEAAGAQALRLISNSDHSLAGVLTTVHPPAADEISGTSKKKPLSTTIAAEAGRLGIPVLDAKQVQNPEFAAWMDSHLIDVLLNVHSLYRICPQVFHSAKVGAFNLHPGPLPQYAGLNVPSWAVFNEEPTHAVTLHHITDKIDTGHIVYETQFPLTSGDTGLTVIIKCAQKGLELIERLIMDLSNDPSTIPSHPQDLNDHTYYKRNDIPGNGFIQWSEPAHKIDAFVRACNYSPFPSPWGEPKTSVGETEISILNTTLTNIICNVKPGTIGQKIDGQTAIATANHWILIDRCKIAGKTVSAASLLKPGDQLSSSS